MASNPLYTLQSLAPTGRKHRRPKHKHQLQVKPYQLQPFMIAPVLPAETLQSYYFEAREVTDPIKSSIVGWASEYWLFYVKIRDLNQRDTLDDLFINPVANVDALNSAADAKYYHRGGSPNFAKLCLERVTQTYFRDAGETWNADTIDGLPAAQYRDSAWMDTLVDTTAMPEGSGDPGSAATPEALDKLMDAFEYLRAMSMVDMDFETYLKSFGVQISRSESHEPELVASWKEFQYPSNTVDPATGTPSSAVSWVFKKMGREKRFFREPGFIFGVHTVRPKLYMARQFGSMTHFLNNGLSWLPAIMKDSPETSLREFPGGVSGVGPLSNGTVGPTNGYWVDMRDLFLYGDQFANFDLAADAGKTSSAALPTASLARKYAAQADVEALFTGGAAGRVRSDGFTSFDILGGQVDFTATSVAA